MLNRLVRLWGNQCTEAMAVAATILVNRSVSRTVAGTILGIVVIISAR